MRPLRTIAPALLLAVGVRAQTPGVPAGEPDRFLQKYIGLSTDQIAQVKRGAVVSKVLDTKDRDEVALFGIVAVDGPRAAVVRRIGDPATFLRTPGRTAFGLFGSPAQPADVAAMTIDPGDVDALKKCQPGDCDVKIPRSLIEEFQRTLARNPAAGSEQLTAHVRQRMVDYAEAYRKSGTPAMVEYADQKEGGRVGAAFESLLAESPYLFEYLPSFQRYLTTYPNGSLPDARDALYWATDHFGGLRPITGITHLTIHSPSGGPLTLVSEKQIYGSHYFLGAFTRTTVLDRPENPAGGSYYIVVQRLRFDHLPSGGLLNIRGRVIGKLHDALRAQLEQKRTTLAMR